MHHALLVEDIQYYIFDKISSKRTLNALSRTCKAFTESALDAQWRDLDSFTRLVECMPQDLWSRRCGHDSTEYTITFCRPISPSDWAIFQKYSHRVLSVKGPFVSSGLSFVDMDDSCIISLCSPSTPIPLLPNLTSLTWSLSSNAEILALSRLVSPYLRSLSVRMRSEFPLSPKFQSVLPIPIDQVRSSLRHFAIGGDKNYATSLLDAVKRSITELQNLHTISWNDLGSETIVSLAQLPMLRRVIFELPSDFTAYIEALPSRLLTSNHAFSRLCEFDIVHKNLASVTAFLDHFDFRFLEKIRITSRHPSPSTAIQELFAALASLSSHDTIHYISVHDKFEFASTLDLTLFCPLGIHELRPLLQLNRLQYLNLNIEYPIIFEDTILLQMADAWPHISTLYLNCNGHWHPGFHITPLAFICLLERCPKLQQLSIPLDFSTVDYVDFDPRSLEGLRVLFGPYFVAHPHAVAKFLAVVLPNLASLTMLSHSVELDPGACMWNFFLTNNRYCELVMSRERITAEGEGSQSHLSVV